MTDHGDIEIFGPSPRQSSPAYGSASPDQRPPLCGAMIQQSAGHGEQSRPQQFVRLVGGHRRPAELQG
jgi:hypothetical protein